MTSVAESPVAPPRPPGPDFTLAQGARLWDASGRSWLDAASPAHFLGRNHPEVHQALVDLLAMELPNLSVVNASALGGLLAGRLIARAGGGFGKCVFANSGSETTEVALRFCRQITRRRRFLYLTDAYHGRSTGSISVCGVPSLRAHFEPAMPTTTMIPPDLARLRRELRTGDVAGLIVEPVQALTGRVIDPAFLREAENLCEAAGTVLIAAEVLTGFGRTGHWFVSDAIGLRPGILTVGKALGGGDLPIGAVLVHEAIYERVYSGFSSGLVYFSTFAENNLAMAAGLVSLDLLERIDAPARAARLGAQLRAGLDALAATHGVTVAGLGLHQVVHVPERANAVAEAAQEAGLIVGRPPQGLHGLRLDLPVVCQEADVDAALEALAAALAGTPTSGARPGPPTRSLGLAPPTPAALAPNRSGGPVLLDADVLVVGASVAGRAAAAAACDAGREVWILDAGPHGPKGAETWTTSEGLPIGWTLDVAHPAPATAPDPRTDAFVAALQAVGATPVAVPAHDVPSLTALQDRGVRVVSGVDAEHLTVVDREVTGVTGRSADGSHVRVSAGVTILAAGAIGTGLLLAPVASPPAIRFHLSATLFARTDVPLAPWRDRRTVTRTDHLRIHGATIDDRVPDLALLAERLVHDNRLLRRTLKRADCLVALHLEVDGEASSGTLATGRLGPTIDFKVADADASRMTGAMAAACDLLAVMGAIEVFPGIAGLPDALAPADLAEQLRATRLPGSDLGLVLVTPHATGQIHPSGAVNGLLRVVVADASALLGAVGPDLEHETTKHAASIGAGLAHVG